MGIFYFPSNFVYWKKIDKHSVFKSKILEHLEKESTIFNINNVIRNGKTTDGNSNTKNFFINYKEFMDSVIWDSLDEVISELDSKKNTLKTNILSSKVLDCWCIKYDKDSAIGFHNHQGTGREYTILNNIRWAQTFTILYIINEPNERSSTEFVQTCSSGVSSHLQQQFFFKTADHEDIGEGTVLVFPSNLAHQALSISKPGRIIFSCDIVSAFK